jgi:DnaJ domain
VSQDRTNSHSNAGKRNYQRILANSHYALLGLHPSASEREIRQAYRDRSKLYHPDTTTLPRDVATATFRQLNEAYATLSSPERRRAYDRQIGYSSVAVVQSLPTLSKSTQDQYRQSSSAYIDATDRPLSGGELFALFILGLTFVGCLVLAIAIGLTRSDALLPSMASVSGHPDIPPTQTVPAQAMPAEALEAQPSREGFVLLQPNAPILPIPVAPALPVPPSSSTPVHSDSSQPSQP